MVNSLHLTTTTKLRLALSEIRRIREHQERYNGQLEKIFMRQQAARCAVYSGDFRVFKGFALSEAHF